MRAKLVRSEGHDGLKLGVVALASAGVVLLGQTVTTYNTPAWLILVLGMAVFAGGGYWVGNRNWIFVPLFAMLAAIAVLVPVTMANPGGGESPVSVILEAPFWVGAPALLFAAAGYMVRRARQVRIS